MVHGRWGAGVECSGDGVLATGAGHQGLDTIAPCSAKASLSGVSGGVPGA